MTEDLSDTNQTKTYDVSTISGYCKNISDNGIKKHKVPDFWKNEFLTTLLILAAYNGIFVVLFQIH